MCKDFMANTIIMACSNTVCSGNKIPPMCVISIISSLKNDTMQNKQKRVQRTFKTYSNFLSSIYCMDLKYPVNDLRFFCRQENSRDHSCILIKKKRRYFQNYQMLCMTLLLFFLKAKKSND